MRLPQKSTLPVGRTCVWIGTFGSGMISDHCPVTSGSSTVTGGLDRAAVSGVKTEGSVWVADKLNAGFGVVAGVFDEVKRKV